MKKAYLFTFFSLTLLTVFGAPQLADRWKKVDELIEKQLPESALQEIESILNDALKTKNFNETIKAYIYKMRLTLDKNPDEAPTLIEEFETFAGGYTKVEEKALLHSMIAELYAMFYNSKQYAINQRTLIEGYVPDDINEWSKNVFFRKIVAELTQSFENAPMLKKTGTQTFESLIVKGKNDKDLQPTLYDFLAYRAIDILKLAKETAPLKNSLNNENYFASAEEFVKMELDPKFDESIENQLVIIFQQLIAFHQSGNNIKALIYADLSRLDYVNSASESVNSSDFYLQALQKLERKYADNEAVASVVLKIVQHYHSQSYQDSSEGNEFKKMAYDKAAECVKRYPESREKVALENIMSSISQKKINISYPGTVKPHSELVIKNTTHNISNLEIKIYRVNATALKYYEFLQNNRGNNRSSFPNRKLLETLSLKVEPNGFGKTESELAIKTLGYGIYEFTIAEKGNHNKEDEVHGTFTVTDFALINRRDSERERSGYVLNRVSGKTIDEVDIQVAISRWESGKNSIENVGNTKSDKNGFFSIQGKDEHYSCIYFLSKGEDRYFSAQVSGYYYHPGNTSEKEMELALFSDRSLYRPGQTVYFKGIAYEKNTQTVVKNESFEVKLLDANYQEVSKQTLKTNEFGSFKGEFVLPQGGLNGAWQIQVNNEFELRIFVEEYKRPTFEITINKPETEVHFDKEVRFDGKVKAYSGYSVSNAQVNYSIVRRQHRLFWRNYSPDKIVATGNATTDSDGKFEVAFTPERAKNNNPLFRDQFYTYSIEASVTDSKGETQRGMQTVSVGDKSLFIVDNVPDMQDKAQEMQIALHTETLNGKVIDSTVGYTIYRLKNDEYRENTVDLLKLPETETVLNGKFDTKDKTLKIGANLLQTGYYKIKFTAPDANNKEVTAESAFIVYDLNDNRPPIKTYSWLPTPVMEVKHGENAEIIFGTSAEDVSVLYEIVIANQVVESRWVTRWVTLSNEIKTFEIPFKPEYGDGFFVQFTFVKDEKFFSHQTQVKRKMEDRSLSPAFSVFRDKLKPGDTEEWTVNIPETVGGKMMAELMITMYDASLDAIRGHNWAFNPWGQPNIPVAMAYWNTGGLPTLGWGYAHASKYFTVNYKESEGTWPDYLNWFGLNLSGRFAGMTMLRSASTSRNAVLMQDAAVPSAAFSEVPTGDVTIVAFGAQKKESVVASISSADAGAGEVQIRTNFNETAFFYPQLRTDKEGNIKFTFTAPESLTRWNIKMLAHTPDLYYGKNEAQAVTQKELMVQLNMPRFVRRSDKLTLAANVINLTESEITANVRFELINPETEKPVALKDNTVHAVTLAAGETKAVEWTITEFSDFELVTVKVIAQSALHSDGEQRYLPVLPDRMMLTETMPLAIRGKQTRDFRFESLLNQAKNVESQSLTIEFSPNPTWYAVQALPTLSEPQSENAIDYFAAYYVNSLAAHIVHSNPKISAIFDRWKNEVGSREALLSNLEKNAELKNMLLDETPWVMTAKNETEQKRRIALLFDLNQQKNRSQQYLEKLISLQKFSGGFSWFDGMSESRYVTQTILLGMARYYKTTGTKPEDQEWLEKAIYYIDNGIESDFVELKKREKDYLTKMCIGDMQWFYLHVRSFYKNIPLRETTIEAMEYYTSQAEKYWTKATLYGKAATALICHRNGKTELADDVMKSLRENALKTDEMGMYWARNTAGYFWNERPISIHTAIMEAFAEVGNHEADLDEMKIWLLKQKQTQRWDSPISTVDAVYALLNYGDISLENERQVEIKMNRKKLEPTSKEAGTGYFKETIPGSEIDAKMGNVTVKKQDAGIGWGAVYWQYYQDIDKVQAHGGALSVAKKLFVAKTEGNKTSMIPIEQAQVKKGDKIITRLVVTTDRNLEFVALKDLRAACLEPVDQRSGMVWREGVAYYETTKDASTQFFFSFLPKGTYTFEYESWANNTGDFTGGVTSVQCLYAPEFASHSSGVRTKVE